MIGVEICNDCNIEYSKEDEHLYLPYYRKLCRVCYNKRCRKNSKNMITKDINSYFRYALQVIKRRGKEVNIDVEYLVNIFNKQNGLCKITGVTLKMNNGEGQKYDSISVDRIDNTKGYVKGNIQIVCHGFNSMKSNHSDGIFKLLLAGAYKYYSNAK